ncbi:hypothetical protein TERMP_01379 [Thermococcus barophilus MP]|uniref:Uncharacterized protein n=1 Tax=Thermococcus barophilus (strain DSM 11836 / MP) TaxID=391623 RepID=F0LHV4_THEBM|nr:hypothetical protein TERMP_01379 [Thermococcus barophilus MP]
MAKGSTDIPINTKSSAAVVLGENLPESRELTSRYEGSTQDSDRNAITPPTAKAAGGDVAFSSIRLLFSLNGLETGSLT